MEQNNKIKKSWYKKWWGILLIIVLIFTISIFVAFCFYIFNLNKEIKTGKFQTNQIFSLISKTNYQNSEQQKTIEGLNSYWTGSTKPKITIVEFSDFSCPLSKNSFSKIREIGLKYKDNVKIIFRDYPLFENSIDLAMSARCAGEQGLFWLMHDKLFANQGVSTAEEIYELAKQIGADENRFKECISSKKYEIAIQKDFSDGQSLEITGTPVWFINGNKIEGDIPYDTFIQIIEQFLK